MDTVMGEAARADAQVVSNGIDFLNEHCQFRDWRNKILGGKKPVDVSSGANCVLARIYGTSEVGFTVLGGDSRDFLWKHGFAPSAVAPGGFAEHTGRLNAIWNRKLGLLAPQKVNPQLSLPVLCK